MQNVQGYKSSGKHMTEAQTFFSNHMQLIAPLDSVLLHGALFPCSIFSDYHQASKPARVDVNTLTRKCAFFIVLEANNFT